MGLDGLDSTDLIATNMALDGIASALDRQAEAMEHMAAAMIAIARKHGDIPDE